MIGLHSVFKLNDFDMVFSVQESLGVKQGLLTHWDASKVNQCITNFKECLALFAYAVIKKDHFLLRVTLASFTTEVIGIAYKLSIPLKMGRLRRVFNDDRLFPREDYACYVDDIYDSALSLILSLQSKNAVLSEIYLVEILAKIYFQLPEFSRVSVHDDLVSVLKNDLKPVAASTAKSQYILDDVGNENSLWSCYPNYSFKAGALIKDNDLISLSHSNLVSGLNPPYYWFTANK